MVVDGCAFRLFYDKYVEASVERTLRAATPNDIYKGKRCTFYYFLRQIKIPAAMNNEFRNWVFFTIIAHRFSNFIVFNKG